MGLRGLFCEGEYAMSESVGKSVKEEREEEKFETRTEVKRLTGLTIFVIVVTVLAVLVAVAVHAQNSGSMNGQEKSVVSGRFSLHSPQGFLSA
jgi:hypothetical protein